MTAVSLLADIWKAAKSVVVGHAVTWKAATRAPVTVNYPDERPDLPKGYRGMPVLKTNLETGELNCTACGLCARSCPVNVIEVIEETDENGKRLRRPKVFNIDMSRCMVCNLCVEACPFDALEMANHFEIADYSVPNLIFNKEQLAEIWKQYDAVRLAGGEKP
ncbi:MAG TPA: NADH-quinone oxidoreductase subunit I [Thermaerobacter sp.]